MRTYSSIKLISLFKSKNLSLFTAYDLGRLLNIDNINSLYKRIQRLEKRGVIRKLNGGKYMFMFSDASDFRIANYLYSPSYISLDTALSFYGILAGFPYKITSITPRRTRNISCSGKEYSYTKISEDLFWGYEKKEDFLMAEPEKALLDYFYLYTKGLRSIDKEELDISIIDKNKILTYLKAMPKNTQISFMKLINI